MIDDLLCSRLPKCVWTEQFTNLQNVIGYGLAVIKGATRIINVSNCLISKYVDAFIKQLDENSNHLHGVMYNNILFFDLMQHLKRHFKSANSFENSFAKSTNN